MNVLTFDIEEWFHLLDFESTKGEQQWQSFETRIYGNVERILQLLEETDTKATFFILGWIAKTYPDIVRRIAQKYQIGSHTMNHQLVWQQRRDEFKEDATSSIKLLEDITGKKVDCFRAPGFSIRESEAWAFEILSEAGILYDSSVFPAAHAHGGMPSFGNSRPSIIRHNGVEVKEFPISSKKMLGKSIVFCGGGYFRLFPYSIIDRFSKQCDDYLLSYIHPRDLDATQPVLKGLPIKRRFRSYVGLKGAEQKLWRYLTDYRFADLSTAAASVDWATAPVVDI